MIRRPPRSTQSRSSAASDVYKRQDDDRAGDGLARELAVRGQVDSVGAYRGVRVELGVELAGREAQLKLPQDGPVDIGLVEQALLEGRGQALEGGRGVRAVVGEGVDAGTQHRGVARDVVGVIALEVHEVAWRCGVGHDEQRGIGPAPQLVEQLAGAVMASYN